MNAITIPYHLVIPTILCVAGLLTILIKRKKIFADRKRKIFWISVIVFFAFYLFIVGGATYGDIYYQYEANRLDLNKDGLFGTDEITNELSEVQGHLTNDVGRNFSFITGLIASLIISTTVYFVGRVYLKIKK